MRPRKHTFKIVPLNSSLSDRNILFIPGGPGLLPNCFSDFAKKSLNKFKVSGIELSAQEVHSLSEVADAIGLAVMEINPDFLVGHSFGGMALLSAQKYCSKLRGQVILSAAPDMSWARNAEAIPISQMEKERIAIAQAQYNSSPTTHHLALLWASWAPYYFSETNRKFGENWLLAQTYSTELFKNRESLLSGFSANQNELSAETLIVAGGNDRLTPLSLFHSWSLHEKKAVSMVNIEGAGHFPWVDAPEKLAPELLNFFGRTKEVTK